MNKKFKHIFSIISIFSLCTTLAFAAKVPGAPTQVTPNSGPVGPAPTTPITTTVNGTPGGPAPVTPAKNLATVVYSKGTVGLIHATLDSYGTIRKTPLGIPETPAFDIAIHQTNTGSNNVYLASWDGTTTSWRFDTIPNNDLNLRVSEQIPISFAPSATQPNFITLKLGRDFSGQILPVVAVAAYHHPINHSEVAYRKNGIWTVVPIASPTMGQYGLAYPGVTLINNPNGVTISANVVNNMNSLSVPQGHLEESNIDFITGTATIAQMITQPPSLMVNFRVSNSEMMASLNWPAAQHCSHLTSQWSPLGACYQPSGNFYDLFYDPSFIPIISAGSDLIFLAQGGSFLSSVGIDNNLVYNWIQKEPLQLPTIYSVGVSRSSLTINALNLYTTTLTPGLNGTTQSINLESNIPFWANLEAKVVPLQ